MKVDKTGITRYITSSGKVLSEYDGDDNLKYNYIYSNGKKLARKNSAGIVTYIHNDYLGSVRAISNNVDSVVWNRDFYPFGEEINASGAGNEYKFTGKEWDEESGLYYSWHRYYSPVLGRFTQVDPLWQKYPSLTSYQYCDNNPLKFVDPDGNKITNLNSWEARKLQSAMCQTEIGRKSWDEMVERDDISIKIVFNQKDKPTEIRMVDGKEKEGRITGKAISIIKPDKISGEKIAEGELIIYTLNLTPGMSPEKFYNFVGVHEATHWLKHMFLSIKKGSDEEKKAEQEANEEEEKSAQQYDQQPR
ncbi:MAG: RHS repeat-associated core domain-containing protein [Dehalococcoidales bacterium]|nr:RHS repeat-associated core domain-containing protein [Dehalococcoidales bacterium]